MEINKKYLFTIFLVFNFFIILSCPIHAKSESEDGGNFFDNIWNAFLSLFSSENEIDENSIDTPIGWEFLTAENHLHTKNQNPLGLNESNIWQNGTSGYTQFFNGEDPQEALARASWVRFGFGLAYYDLDGGFNYIIRDVLNNPINNVSSDNQTYWSQLLYKCGEYNGVEYCGGFNRSQETYDRLMKNDLYFYVNPDTPLTINRNFSTFWGFLDSNIENDNDIDIVNYCYNEVTIIDENSSQVQRICDEIRIDTTNFLKRDITYFELVDNETQRGHYVEWDEETPVDLRIHQGDLMLEVEKGMPNNWYGLDETPFRWIDAGEVPCNDGIDGDGNSIICPNNANDISGYINQTSGFVTSFSYHHNVQPLVGRKTAGQLVSGEKRGYIGFNPNSSEIPANSTINEISLWYGIPPIGFEGTVSGLVTDIYTCGNNCVADNNGLEGGEVGDWKDGNFTYEVIWSNECGINEPCEIYINLTTNSSLTDFYTSMETGSWFHVIFRDDSLYTAGQTWESIIDILGSPIDTTNRTHLIVKFTPPEEIIIPESSINISLENPADTSIFDYDSAVNFSALINSTYDIDHINFTINGTTYQNATDIANGTNLQGGYGELTFSDGTYYWWITVLDKNGGIADSINNDTLGIGMNWSFTISEQVILVNGSNITRILPYNDRYPLTRLNESKTILGNQFIKLNQTNLTKILPLNINYPDILLNETNNLNIKPYELKYPYVQLNRSVII